MDTNEIQGIVLDALRNANLARDPEQQLTVAPDAAIFGRGSALDSLGLVALLIDIEEALASRGATVTLTNERAMSRSRTPFRSVPSLVAYISELLDAPGQGA